MKPVFLLVVLMALLSCAKLKVEPEKVVLANDCHYSTLATVQKMKLNEDGSEYFYYLRLENSPIGVHFVYPSQLDQSFKVENKRLNISFNTTDQAHQFVLCPKGHVYDPYNPDYQHLPIIKLCSAKNKS